MLFKNSLNENGAFSIFGAMGALINFISFSGPSRDVMWMWNEKKITTIGLR